MNILYHAHSGLRYLVLLAALATHASSIIGQRSSSERRELVIRLAGIVVALVLIVGGIMAIGRGVFGTAPLSVG